MTKDKDLPAAPPASGETTSLTRRSEKGILCAKCNHLNKPHSSTCSSCGSHLHIKCKDCGARSERHYSRCQECGRRLHKSILEKMQRSVFKHDSKITMAQAGWMVVVVGIILLLVIAAGSIELPGF